MKNILTKLKTFDTIYLLSIIVLGIFQVLRCPDLPGLYLDAVNPDYLAVQILFPQNSNPNWAPAHSGIPLLGQLYHGTITVLLQLLIVGIFGKASPLTLKLSNITYIIAICWVMYLILKKLEVNKVISFLVINALILSPNVFSLIRTQYYIKLPGTLFLMLSMYFAILSIEQNRHVFYLALSSIFLGIAFYSYFIFLFFAPAILIFCLSKTKKLGLKLFKDAFIWCMGFGCGCIPYVIGYGDLIITSTALDLSLKKGLVIIGGILLLVIMVAFLYVLVNNYQNDKVFHHCCLAVFTLLVVFFIIAAINFKYITGTVLPILSSLGMAGGPMRLTQRIVQIFLFWTGVMDNSFLEQLMLGTVSSYCPSVLIILFLLAFALACILTVTKRMNKNDWKEILAWGSLLLCYGILCIPFISRMGGQHFTPVFFITFMIFILLCNNIWSKINNKHIKKALPLLLGIFFLWSILNCNLLQANLQFTGGKNMYSETINELAENALSEKCEGQKNVYVFPEWGFMCGFNYLTENQVPYTTTVDANMLQEYFDRGYGFKLCVWNHDSLEQYMEQLKSEGMDNLSVDTMQSREGEIVFYILKKEYSAP